METKYPFPPILQLKGDKICKIASNFSYLGHYIFNLTLGENALDCFEFLEFFFPFGKYHRPQF